jgi:4-carboxymuconolactone decarboxylase
MTTPQGFAGHNFERIPLIPESELSEAQRAAADAIIRGPRKAIFGPFLPLLHTPALMERLGELGAALRFNSGLPDRIRELVIAATARATDNQFEWQTHAPLALKAGISEEALDAVAVRQIPRGLREDEAAALDLVYEILNYNGLSNASFAEVERLFGRPGVVELTVLVGYFATICWVMNVARTPGPGGYPALQPTPA